MTPTSAVSGQEEEDGCRVDTRPTHVWLAGFHAEYDADETLAALVEILERIPEPLRRTFTWDQGREMARRATLA